MADNIEQQLSGLGGAGSGELQKAQEQAQKQQQMEEMRQHMLGQVMLPDARERLSRIKLVKPENARAVEDMLIRAAQTGQLAQKVDERQLIQMLESLSEKKSGPKITIQRRRYSDDD